MAVLIGATTEGVSAYGPPKERGQLTKRTAAKTGKVETLKVKVSSTSVATKYRLAIFKASAEKPGTLMAESVTITVAKETALTVEAPITATEITEGVEYFLGVLSLDAAWKLKATEKAGFGFQSTGAITELNKGTFTEAAAKFGEPAAVWGEGTEGGSTLLASPTVVLTMKDSAVAAQGLTAKATDKLELKDTAKVAQTVAPMVAARFVLQDSVKAAQTLAGALSERLELKDPLKATFTGESVSEAKIVMPLDFKQSLAATQKLAAQLADRMSLKCTVKANFVTEGGTRRVAIFIFED